MPPLRSVRWKSATNEPMYRELQEMSDSPSSPFNRLINACCPADQRG